MMDHKTRLGAWLFPILLAVCMGGVSFWLNEISQVDVVEAPINPDVPRYTMMNVTGKVFSNEGLVAEDMVATSVWQLPESDLVEFSMPVIKIYQQGNEIYNVKSNLGRYDTENKWIYFDNNVVLTKIASKDEAPGFAKTEHLQVDTVTQIAKTDDLVDFQMGLSTGQSQGLVYDHTKQNLNLKSRVRAIIYEPTKS